MQDEAGGPKRVTRLGTVRWAGEGWGRPASFEGVAKQLMGQFFSACRIALWRARKNHGVSRSAGGRERRFSGD